MFGIFTDIVEETISTLESTLVYGELPTKRQLAKFIDAGLTIYAISEATGFATDLLEEILEE